MLHTPAGRHLTRCRHTDGVCDIHPDTHRDPAADGCPGVARPGPVAAPTHLTFAAAGIDGPVEEYTAADAAAEGGINPATLDTISWYSGVPDPMPGTIAKNTVYLFGHAWIQPAVFNGLEGCPARAIRPR